MQRKIEIIKKNEGNLWLLELFDMQQIEKFQNLYKKLPITVHNKKQNVIKKGGLMITAVR